MTGTPIRNSDFISIPLALAEPVPFALATLIVNSLTEGLLITFNSATGPLSNNFVPGNQNRIDP
jgi:hypothetical protein